MEANWKVGCSRVWVSIYLFSTVNYKGLISFCYFPFFKFPNVAKIKKKNRHVKILGSIIEEAHFEMLKDFSSLKKTLEKDKDQMSQLMEDSKKELYKIGCSYRGSKYSAFFLFLFLYFIALPFFFDI